jgi:primosomal protein N' (replication factor Y)
VIARVLIDGPSELVFDYAIPDGLPVVEGCRVRVPIRQKTSSGTVLSITPQPESSEFAMREVKSLIDPDPLITPTLLKVARWIANYYGSSIESVIRSILPEAVRTEDNSAKTRRIATANADPDLDAMAKLEKRAAKQHAILTILLHAPGRTMAVADLGENSAPSLKSLAEKGFITISTEEVRRDPEAEETIIPSEPLALNDQQQEAFDAISASLRDLCASAVKPFLLLGVTGSGKTEVYLQSAQAALDLDKTVLVLVPEIALTPQTVRRFKARFSYLTDQVAVLHSNLSQGERFDEWHRIRKGTARIVIGARSAVFAPLPNLGLIIIDEEHESTYKQENVPRYQARDVAVLRAAFEPCTIVLGSATPSLES